MSSTTRGSRSSRSVRAGAFLIRSKQGGKSRDIKPGPGDLLVMGGRAQMDWEHNVPKTRRAVGPRISCSWRWMRASADQATG